ncbi:MAG: trypsin-like peptidase domain-containing protein [Gammaproteobacteria bacterium]|nr:trypsin-like peptidase domain-containing protein [Gammaproteobacteria bacterium]
MASRLSRFLPVVLGVTFGLLLGLVLGREPPTPAGQGGYAEAVARAAPAVVNIYTSKVVTTRVHPLCDLPRFRQFCARVPGTQQRMQGSLGSGVVVRSDGIILTNRHVIADADEIRVGLADGREARAEVLGTDSETDLAVLKIDLPTPDVVEPAAGDGLAVGDVVLAIGNPFGIGQTVSQGIVSAMGRHGLMEANPFEDFIQTDAPINPGNSGGALVDSDGRLVGLNTLIFSRSGGYQGISFAIPARLAFEVLEDIIRKGEVIRGWLGIEVSVPDSSDEAGGLPVSRVAANGPGAAAGLRRGDLIIAVDEAPVGSAREMAQRIAMLEPGERVRLGILRDQRHLELDAVVGQRPG